MQKNLMNSLAVLAIVIFVAAGCSMMKKADEKNTTVSSNNTTANTPDAVPSSSVKAPPGKAVAWNLGNNLGMAAILYDLKGSATSDSLSKAQILAQEVGASVPPFPSKSGDKIKDTASILGWLLNDAFKDVGSAVKTKYGAEEAALFEISLKADVLLLIYGPGEKEGQTIAKVIRNNAKTANLPENLWMPLVDKIESSASFDDVKSAVLEMQKNVSQHLNKA